MRSGCGHASAVCRENGLSAVVGGCIFSSLLVILAAVLTGALLPLLFQLRATLRSAQTVLDVTTPKLARTLDEVQATVRELRLVTAGLAEHRPQVQEFMAAVGGLTTTINQLQASVRTASAVGAAIGPALAAAFQAFRNVRAEDAAHLRLAPGGASEVPAGRPPSEGSDE